MVAAPCPPAFDSLMPPVRGLLQPTERRLLVVAGVADSRPGAKTSLLPAPSAWHSGSTSSATRHDVSPLPPSPAYLPNGSMVVVGPPWAARLIRRILSMCELSIN